MFNALILDWSGTLVDDMGPTLAATNAVLERFEKPTLTKEEFRARFRLPYSEFYDEHVPDVPLDELETHFREAFDTTRHPVTPLEGTREFLEWCVAQGIRLFVLTSMDAPTFAAQLHDFGFAKHFEATYAGVLDKRLVIHRILETHGLRPEETAYVGDMVHDIETARHGGVTPVGVLSGYDHHPRLAEAAPELLLSCIKSLHAILAQSRGGSRATGECIEIRRLRVSSTIGVPDEERSTPQDLYLTIRLIPALSFDAMGDEISRTIDYDAVARRVAALAGEGERRLIESLASEVARTILAEFPTTARVSVEIEKHILPDTDFVAVRTTLSRNSRAEEEGID